MVTSGGGAPNSQVNPAQNNAVNNVMQNRFTIIVTPYLDVTTGFPGTSNTAWYLASTVSQVPTVSMVFLRGNERPFLAREDGFKVDGRAYKVRHVVGSKAFDHRGLQKNAGV